MEQVILGVDFRIEQWFKFLEIQIPKGNIDYDETWTFVAKKCSDLEEDHVYENALAERVNGILKDEFLLDERSSSEDLAQRAVREAVRHYNELRLHMSLGYETPDQRYAA